MVLVEKLSKTVHHNQDVLQVLFYVPIKLVLHHLMHVRMKIKFLVHPIECLNAKIKLVWMLLMLAQQELLVLMLIWSYALIKHVLNLNCNVDNLHNVLLDKFCVMTNHALWLNLIVLAQLFVQVDILDVRITLVKLIVKLLPLLLKNNKNLKNHYLKMLQEEEFYQPIIILQYNLETVLSDKFHVQEENVLNHSLCALLLLPALKIVLDALIYHVLPLNKIAS